MNSPIVINPAATGSGGGLSGFLNYRDQWAGLKGAPETAIFGVHGLITESMGIGLDFSQQKEGIFKQFSANLNYSYKDKITENQSIAFGLSMGIMQNNISIDDVVITDNSDIALYSNKLNEAIFQTGFGIIYKFKNLNISLATPLLYQTQTNKLFHTALAHVSYDLYFKQKIWRVQPSVLYRYTINSDYNIDINLMSEWYEKIWLLVGYRTNKNAVVGGGFFLKNFGIGYNYEINRSEFYTISSGSHEIMLFYESKYSSARGKKIL